VQYWENMNSKLSVLILEDEEILLHKIKSSFEEQLHNVTVSRNIQDTLVELSKNFFDVLILDRMISSEDSLTRLKEFREFNPQLAILILSAIDSPVEKANALDLGADDYLGKPYETVELIARAKKIVQKNELLPTIIPVGDLTLKILNLESYYLNINLNLSSKEFLILKLLSSKPGKIFKKENILNEVWGYSPENKTNIVEANVNSLRRKIEFTGSSIQIKNTRFLGYWIEI
jgi:DNA-binding response OmpR family regulator